MSIDDHHVALRERELATREAELNRREAQLSRRESALAGLAAEIAAERERVGRARTELLQELSRTSIHQRQAATYAFAAPRVTEPDMTDDEWWAKVLGRRRSA